MDTRLQPRICSASVRGNSHVLRDIPNQDSSCYKFSSSKGSWAAAIADGHGSSAHPKSDIGSRIAVQCAVDVLLGYLESNVADSIDLRATSMFALCLTAATSMEWGSLRMIWKCVANR